MIGVLGDVTFRVSVSNNRMKILTLDDLSMNMSASYEEHSRAKGKPSLEFSKLNLDTVSLTIELNSSLGYAPLDEFKKLKKHLENHEVIRFILNRKSVGHGYYVIESIGSNYDHIDGNGFVHKMDVSISLKEYR